MPKRYKRHRMVDDESDYYLTKDDLINLTEEEILGLILLAKTTDARGNYKRVYILDSDLIQININDFFKEIYEKYRLLLQ